MEYRILGKTGIKVSALGFGAMRLPVMNNKDDQIDEKKAIEIIRSSIDMGVNYLDTAYPYHGGNSELLCAKVMQDGYREKVYIATKMPSWELKTYDDMERILDEQLKKLQVNYIDFYLLHAIGEKFWETYQKLDYKKFLEKAKKTGKIKFAGFSFHDNIDLFKKVIDDYDWDFCQIQLNYLDETFQAGLEGMHYAAEKGIGVIIMEPLRGGTLARNDIPEDLQSIWNSFSEKRTPAEWAFRYLYNYPQVSLVLSGMASLQQVKENVGVAADSRPNSLTEQEIKIIERAKKYYKGKIRVNCTNCRYCMPCPYGVNIPELFWGYNHDSMFGDFGKAKYWTTGFLPEPARAHNCIECGACMDHCPQHIDIPKHMKIITQLYGKGE